eukprot:gene8876-7513_t
MGAAASCGGVPDAYPNPETRPGNRHAAVADRIHPLLRDSVEDSRTADEKQQDLLATISSLQTQLDQARQEVFEQVHHHHHHHGVLGNRGTSSNNGLAVEQARQQQQQQQQQQHRGGRFLPPLQQPPTSSTLRPGGGSRSRGRCTTEAEGNSPADVGTPGYDAGAHAGMRADSHQFGHSAEMGENNDDDDDTEFDNDIYNSNGSNSRRIAAPSRAAGLDTTTTNTSAATAAAAAAAAATAAAALPPSGAHGHPPTSPTLSILSRGWTNTPDEPPPAYSETLHHELNAVPSQGAIGSPANAEIADMLTLHSHPVRYVAVGREPTLNSYGFGFGTTTAGIKVVTTINRALFSAASPLAVLSKGDVIAEIDGTSAHTISHAEAISHFRGSSRVTLGVWDGVHADLSTT